MLGFFSPALAVPPAAILAQSALHAVSPVAVLVLCVIAGFGTMLLLPSHLQPPMRKLGGALLIACGLVLLALLVRSATANNQHVAQSFYFWAFSAISLFGAMRVVTHPRPVYSALYFVLTVFATAGLFVLLQADFIAAALVIIYAGAILITYVFVIMLAAQARSADAATAAQQLAAYDALSREPIVASVVGFALMGLLLFVIFDKAETLSTPVRQAAANVPDQLKPDIPGEEMAGNTQMLGVFLYNSQQVSLELAGILLTVAMIGAIVIARRRVLTTEPLAATGAVLTTPATPVNDNPHSIPVYGTDNPRQKEYPET
jgi:NADH-quinone oxidoreductase subunit J